MKALSRFEADLVRLLHALLGRAPVEGALSLIGSRRERPACLGREAVDLIEDALAKGFVWRLAREAGWRHDRHLRGDRVADGRLWERTSPGALAPDFSRDALEFLLWLACRHPADRPAHWRPSPDALTPGDQFLMFAAYETLRTSTFGTPLRESAPFLAHGLCRLAFPEDFTDAPPPDLSPWTTGLRSCIFEALQPYLAARWRDLELSKARYTDPGPLLALGRAQESVRDALLTALDAAGRRDLARFLLDAAAGAVRHDRPGNDWIDPQLLKGLRLADRARVGRSALTLLTTLGRLQSWEREARAVGYFDEGYAAAQLCKADWEAAGGEALSERADTLLRELDPLGA